MVVGASSEDSSTTGVNSTPNEAPTRRGHHRRAQRATWTQQAYLKPADVGTTQARDRFGYSVAVSGDTVVVGAPYESSSTTGVNSTLNESARSSGAAYVFVRSAGVWTQQAYLKPAAVGTTQQFDGFGNSVAVSGDTVVVGAPAGAWLRQASTARWTRAPLAGTVYVFTRRGWTQQAYLKPAAVGKVEMGSALRVRVGDTRARTAPTGVNSTPNPRAAAYVSCAAGGWTRDLKPAAVGPRV
ncbi:MAG: FG-GAP repeat protein [Chloroflexia bacterium]